MATQRLLMNNFKQLQQDPIEGFAVEIDDENIYNWKVWVEGPTETFYEGGIFEMQLQFPSDYPMSPPKLRFISDFWHPNVYSNNGLVCISILHAAGEDQLSGEDAGERWMPTQSVGTIMLSVISLLSSPNFSSPANVDASVQWRKNPDAFKARVKELIKKAKANLPPGLRIPHPDTDEKERQQRLNRIKSENNIATNDFVDDLMYDDVAMDEEEEEDEDYEEEEQDEQDEDEENEEKQKQMEEGESEEEEQKGKQGKKEKLSSKNQGEKNSKQSPSTPSKKQKSKSKKTKPNKGKEEQTESDKKIKSKKDSANNNNNNNNQNPDLLQTTTSTNTSTTARSSTTSKRRKRCTIV